MPAGRRLFALVAVLGLLLGACSPGAEGEGAAADLVPDAPLETFEGEETSLHDFLGRPMVINFWASWCAPCIEEMPDFEEVHLAVQDEVRFLGIDTQDAVDAALEMVAETGVTYDLVRDPLAEAFQAFGIRGMPSTFLVDAEGRILFRHTGPLTAEDLRGLIDEHLPVASSG